jgi:hypothetical protein
LDLGWIEKIALDDFCTVLAEFIGPGIEFMDEGANGNALREQETRDEASGRSLQTAGCACDQNRVGHGGSPFFP